MICAREKNTDIKYLDVSGVLVALVAIRKLCPNATGARGDIIWESDKLLLGPQLTYY